MFAKLPYQIAIRWKAIVARGACKVKWDVCSKIPIFLLNLAVLKLLDASERILSRCVGNELSHKSGQQLSDLIRKTNIGVPYPNKPDRVPILFINPKGYHTTLVKYSERFTPKHRTKKNAKEQKNFDTHYKTINNRFAKIFFDLMSYGEYLEC